MKTQSMTKTLLILSALFLAPQLALATPVLDCVVTKVPQMDDAPAVGDALIVDLNLTRIESLDFLTADGKKSSSLNLGSIPLKQKSLDSQNARYLAIGFGLDLELVISSADGILNQAKVNLSSLNNSGGISTSTIELACTHIDN